jgi:hypothetical protein
MNIKRFHNPAYKRQIQAVRAHKRPVFKKAEGKFESLLHGLGLGSRKRQFLAAIIFLLLVYLFYFAPFLKITSATVNGASPEESSAIESALKDYTATFFYIFPQKNILFFSGSRFKSYLLARDYSISSVKQIQRKFPHSLEISIDQRVAAYTFQSQGNFYILNSDGNLSSQVAVANSNFTSIIDTAVEQVSPGDHIFDLQKYSFLDYINANFQSQTQAQIDHFEIPGKASSDLLLFSKAGFKVYFDSTTDPKLFLQRFFAIWAGLNPSQQKKLAYADLRFDPKVYICYLGDACAN